MELAHLAGAIAGDILFENGEETFHELLFDISRKMVESAKWWPTSIWMTATAFSTEWSEK